MAKSSTPNLFIALGLNPDNSWTFEEINRLLEKKKLEWSKDIGKAGPKKIKAELYLKQYTDKWKRLTSNDIAIEAEEARKAINADREAKLSELDGEVSSLAARGYLYQEEFDRLAHKYKELIHESELRTRIRVEIKASENYKKETQSISPTDQTTINLMKPHLDYLEVADLYAFLGVDSSKTRIGLEQLQDLANTKYNTAVNGLATDLKNHHTKDLAGICQTVFKTNETRASYDEHLRQLAYQFIRDEVTNLCQISVKKEMNVNQVEHFLEIATQKGLDRIETFENIKNIATSSGFSIVMPSEFIEKQIDKLICGSCNSINNPGESHCTVCGKPLLISCPRCGNNCRNVDSACGKCGFPIGNFDIVELWLTEAESQAAASSWKAAQDYLDLAKKAWPAPTDNPLVVRLSKVQKDIDKGLQTVTQQLANIQNAIKKKHYFEARKLISNLNLTFENASNEVKSVKNEVDEVISRVNKLCLEGAEQSNLNNNKAIALYTGILLICADCQEARNFLQLYPPEPPESAYAEIIGKVIRLKWKSSPSDNVSYAIVRKENKRPSDFHDGTLLRTISDTFFDDNDCPGGIPVFYAVYASRGEILSKVAAIIADPIQLFPEVEDLSTQVTSDSVRLSWKRQPNVFDIVVIRNKGWKPKSVSDGVSVPLIDGDQALDSGLENNTEYHYAVYCQYQNIKCEIVTSLGNHISATPQLPPDPILDMMIRVDTSEKKHKVLLTWHPVVKGHVMILKSTSPLPMKTGSSVSKVQVSSLGELITPDLNSITDVIEKETIVYYTPFVFYSGQAIVGQFQRYIDVPDVKGLEILNVGFALRCKWHWPQDCEEVRILVENSLSLEPDKSSREITLMKSQYESKGYYDLTGIPKNHDVQVNILAVYNTPSGTILSAGVNKKVVLASQITVFYEISYTLMSGTNLKLRVNGNGFLPSLLLVRKKNQLPLDSSDGDIILKVEEIQLSGGEKTFSYPINKNELLAGCFGRLFLGDNSYSETVIIRTPDRNRLKLCK